MSYQLRILRRGQKELGKLQNPDYKRVRDAIRRLAVEPRPAGCKKLSIREGWRIRIGSYRVIYEIDDRNRRLTILHIGQRSSIYR